MNAQSDAECVRSGVDRDAEPEIYHEQINSLIVASANAVGRLLDRERSLSNNRLLLVDDCQRAFWNGARLELTRLEYHLLRALALQPGKLCSFRKLHTAVWPSPYHGDRSAVHSAIARLRRKTTGCGSGFSIVSVRSSGFRLILSMLGANRSGADTLDRTEGQCVMPAAEGASQHRARLHARNRPIESSSWTIQSRSTERRDDEVGRAKKPITTLADAAAILNAAFTQDHQWGVIAWLAMVTGARRGELCALHRSDVKLSANLLLLRRTYAVRRGRKSEKPLSDYKRCNLSIDEATAELIRHHWQLTTSRAQKLGLTLPEDPYLFSYENDHRSPCNPDGIGRRYAVMTSALGVRRSLCANTRFAVDDLIRQIRPRTPQMLCEQPQRRS